MTKFYISDKTRNYIEDIDDSIYSKINFRCEESNEEFKNKIALTTHSYSHNRKYLENTG